MKLVGIQKQESNLINSKPMNKMEPLEICIISDDRAPHRNGEVVMRSASEDTIEIISLTNPRSDGCWDSKCTLNVVNYTEKSITLLLD